MVNLKLKLAILCAEFKYLIKTEYVKLRCFKKVNTEKKKYWVDKLIKMKLYFSMRQNYNIYVILHVSNGQSQRLSNFAAKKMK